MRFFSTQRQINSRWSAATIAGLMAVITMAGCQGGDGKPEENVEQSPVLATVGGQAITEADIAFSMERTLNDSNVPVNDELRKKMLDSLIASRAMQQLAKQAMSAEDIAKIRAKVQAYEEELFVKEYLRTHVQPEPVTTEMVEQYYRQHKEAFGGAVVRKFELLKAPTDQNESQRDALLADISVIRNTQSWSGSAEKWRERFGLEYKEVRSKKALLHKQLERALAGLENGETSNVIYVDGVLHLIRLNHVAESAPKPLAEVSADIRKRLAPLMLREAVRQASEKARATVSVEIKDGQ